MALTMKEKFARINLSKLPDNVKSEFELIKSGSDNFDPELVPVFQENFDLLYGLVEKKHPEALGLGGKIKHVKPTKVKKVKGPKADSATKRILPDVDKEDIGTLMTIASFNEDYFEAIKAGTIGVAKVAFGTEDGNSYMDTYSKDGKHGARYYYGKDKKLSVKKPEKSEKEKEEHDKWSSGKIDLDAGKTMVHKSRGKDKTDLMFLIDQLENSMEHYTQESFADHISEETDFSKSTCREIFKGYWELDPKDRSKTTAQWGGWLKKYTIEETPVHKKAEVKEKAEPGGDIDDCRKILTEAGYTTKKKLAATGNKAMKVKEPREERVIIKDKVDGVFTTILKEVSGSKEKDEKYSAMQKSLNEVQSLMTKLFQRLNNLAEDNSTDKVNQILALLKKIVD